MDQAFRGSGGVQSRFPTQFLEDPGFSYSGQGVAKRA